jgi:hypothetical protein
MQKVELRVGDDRSEQWTDRPDSAGAERSQAPEGTPDEEGIQRRAARRLALVLMAASSLFMVGLIGTLWLLW